MTEYIEMEVEYISIHLSNLEQLLTKMPMSKYLLNHLVYSLADYQ
jgi:hypothetical protein